MPPRKRQASKAHRHDRVPKAPRQAPVRRSERIRRRNGTSILSLPPELRNAIYILALVSNQTIDIRAAPLNRLETYGDWERLPETKENIENKLLLVRPVVKRTCWETDLMQFVRKFPTGFGIKRYMSSYESYDRLGLALNLFLVNRQMYQEASSLFYKENCFRFHTS
ncbi:hypothetical protein BDV95DRAFT_619862 [Massariosphaeria phaeospora]|uniref:Uncharacterized protein n=1 Tax=Massariosphaeria phaeospora TaxID=100035 RepID=A0A7C8I3L6_9PLEO|nr:hypothetical protein BDV95DRAFT_619862 [Massariosphaeria phaeospora]